MRLKTFKNGILGTQISLSISTHTLHFLTKFQVLKSNNISRFATVCGTGISLYTTGLPMKPLRSPNLFETGEGDVPVNLLHMICGDIGRTGFAILKFLFVNALIMLLTMDLWFLRSVVPFFLICLVEES